MNKEFTFEERLEAVRLYEEDRLSPARIARKLGTVHSAVERWISLYKYNGEEGIKVKPYYKRYGKDFIDRIKKEVLEEKLPYTRVAAMHNLSSSTVRRWCVEYGGGSAMGGNKAVISGEEAAEIRAKYRNTKDPELRKLLEKNEWLEMENEALKKFHALVQEHEEKKQRQ